MRQQASLTSPRSSVAKPAQRESWKARTARGLVPATERALPMPVLVVVLMTRSECCMLTRIHDVLFQFDFDTVSPRRWGQLPIPLHLLDARARSYHT